ncbi:IS630 family transposase [Bacillus cereus]|uniref:IS630 family transposase n=1 Tax=Bacillus cereus TaxID=1396 RepID=UPI0005B317D5|nr:IS630 family transposase [Bacillus cereus]
MNENTALLYQDECHFRDSQTVHATWFAKGKQKKIAVLGKRISMSLFGTIDAITGKLLCTKADCCNAETFQQFLTYVLKEYENKHVVLVYHHAKVLKPFIRENNHRLTLLFLPPYSPNLNMIERIWKVMKENVLANCYHETMDHLMDSIYQFIESIDKNPEAILSRIQRVNMLIF